MNKQNIIELAAKASETLAEYIYPSDIYCIGCGCPVEPRGLYSLCEKCIKELRWANGPVCRLCGKALEEWYPEDTCAECSGKDRHFSGGVTCFVYKEPIKAVLKHLKYGGSGYLARFLGEILADSIRARGFTPDLLVPVPMYYKKVRLRGYNQAELVARFAAERLQVPCSPGSLIRVRATAPMSRLKGKERRRNLAHAFQVPEEARSVLAGKTIMLVDDIYTTGTTMDCCAEILLKAGAAEVLTAAVAAGYNQRLLPDPAEKLRR